MRLSFLAYRALTFVLFVLAVWCLIQMAVVEETRYESGFAAFCALVGIAIIPTRPPS